MTKLLIAISVFLFVGSPFANAEQVYYCASELATGIKKDEKTGEWKRMGFTEKRYTIKFYDDHTKLEGVDDYNGTWNCFKPYMEELIDSEGDTPVIENMIVCYSKLNSGDVFSFDYNNLRFFHSWTPVTGYLHNTKNADTNSMYAGTCQKF